MKGFETTSYEQIIIDKHNHVIVVFNTKILKLVCFMYNKNIGYGNFRISST